MGQSLFLYICSSSQGSAVIRVFSLIKILVALCGKHWYRLIDRSLSSIAACSLRKLLRKQLSRSSGRVPCGTSLSSSCGPLLRSVKSGDLELQLLLCSSVFGRGKMITLIYAEEARFFLQCVILGIGSIAAMFYTTKELDDPPNGRFWTLSLQTVMCTQRRI